jgi:hypothetical protein
MRAFFSKLFSKERSDETPVKGPVKVALPSTVAAVAAAAAAAAAAPSAQRALRPPSVGTDKVVPLPPSQATTAVKDRRWISEAILEFLRGPDYTHPLMQFIDEHCLVFTPEEVLGAAILSLTHGVQHSAAMQCLFNTIDREPCQVFSDTALRRKTRCKVAAGETANPQLLVLLVLPLLLLQHNTNRAA